MLIKIDDIKIKKRIRTDIGDIDLLKESISKFGLFHPIILNDKYELISGYRRLSSVKALGWSEVEVKIVNNLDKIELIEWELEENLVRKDFTDEELKSAYKTLSKLQNPSFINIILRKIKLFFRYLLKKRG